VWRSGLDLKMGEQILAKDIRSGEGGGYIEIKGPLKGSLSILRNATGRSLLSQESELKKDTFNTVIIYGSLGEDKSSLQMLFHVVEKENAQNPGLSLLNCIDFFDVQVAVGGGASRVYPLAEWQKISTGDGIKSLLMSFDDEKKRKVEFTQQLIMEPAQEYWVLLTPNPHAKAFHRPRVTLIHESKARAEALEPPVEEPKPAP